MRHTRIVIAYLALFSIFFMQFATAGYVCPQHSAALPAHAEHHFMGGNDEVASSCHKADDAQPNLCSAHAQAGYQSLDKHQVPPVQPFFGAFLVSAILPAVDPPSRNAIATSRLELLQRQTAPPSSIRHCCFRI